MAFMIPGADYNTGGTLSMNGYIFESREHGQFTPDGKVTPPVPDSDAHNRAQSAAEVAAFKARSADRWFAYWQEAYFDTLGATADNVRERERDAKAKGSRATHVEIRTFGGDTLARVTWAGPEYRCHTFGYFPSRRRNFRALGIDGREWSGTYYMSSGDYVRMRAIKGGR